MTAVLRGFLLQSLWRLKGLRKVRFVAVCVTIYNKGGSDREIFGPRSWRTLDWAPLVVKWSYLFIPLHTGNCIQKSTWYKNLLFRTLFVLADKARLKPTKYQSFHLVTMVSHRLNETVSVISTYSLLTKHRTYTAYKGLQNLEVMSTNTSCDKNICNNYDYRYSELQHGHD